MEPVAPSFSFVTIGMISINNLNADGGWRAGTLRTDDPVEGISGKMFISQVLSLVT